jgi:hypothetical protein
MREAVRDETERELDRENQRLEGEPEVRSFDGSVVGQSR